MAQVAPSRPKKQLFTDGPTDRWMDRLTDRRMDGQCRIFSYRVVSSQLKNDVRVQLCYSRAKERHTTLYFQSAFIKN